MVAKVRGSRETGETSQCTVPDTYQRQSGHELHACPAFNRHQSRETSQAWIGSCSAIFIILTSIDHEEETTVQAVFVAAVVAAVSRFPIRFSPW